jgi:kynurenine formamidase
MNRKLGESERSITIDEVPLEWCFQPGVKLDFRHLPDGHVVSAAEVEAELKRIGHTVAAGNRGGQHARRLALWPAGLRQLRLRHGLRSDHVSAGARRAPDRHRCVELGRAVQLHGEKIQETGDVSLIWEGHKAGRDIGYCHLEKMHNLEALPPTGFTISCFPHKIRGASAGWTRAVAIFEDA